MKKEEPEFIKSKEQAVLQLIMLHRNNNQLSYTENKLSNPLFQLECLMNVSRFYKIIGYHLIITPIGKNQDQENQFIAFADSLNYITAKKKLANPYTFPLNKYSCFDLDLFHKLENNNWIDCPSLNNSSLLNADHSVTKTLANVYWSNLCPSYTTQNAFDLINPSLLLVNKE